MATLEGAVAVVTGASRGIGSAIAEELGRGGAKVVVNYSRSKEPAEELVKKLKEQGAPQELAIQADVSGAAQATTHIEKTAKQPGRIDDHVNNTGTDIQRTATNNSADDWTMLI